MLKSRIVSNVVFLFSLFLLTGCPWNKLDKLPEDFLSCEAVVADGPFDSGASINVEVKPSGGSGPYSVLGRVGTFETSVNIQRSYENNTDQEALEEDTVVVFDSIGLSAQCTYTVQINPSTDAPQDPMASVAAMASPAVSVEVGNSIEVTALAEHFDLTPDYSFSFSETGVKMDQTDEKATFTSDDNKAHTFEVTITAKTADQEASTTIQLSFTELPPLDCEITHNDGPFVPGDSVNFTISASNGEKLEITGFDAGTDGSAALASDGTVVVEYTSGGSKLVRATAKSLDSDRLCHGGAIFSTTIDVNQALSCEAFTEFNAYFAFEDFWTWVEIPSNAGKGAAKIVSVSATGGGRGSFFFPDDFPHWAQIQFHSVGIFQLQLTVEDSSGAQATCDTDTLYIY